MFGYLRPEVNELKVRQHTKYKALYCGLCKSIGRNTSQANRLALQYDMASFAYILSDIMGLFIKAENQRCIAHPLAKRPMALDNEALKYCAYVSSLLSYNKLDDMWMDEKALYAPLGKFLFRSGYKKALINNTKLNNSINEQLELLHKHEKEKGISMDYPANTSGMIMEAIAYNSPIEDDTIKRLLAEMMKNLGMWLYLADAIDDLEQDLKKKTYNPFINDGKINTEDVEKAKDIMIFMLAQAAKARDLMLLDDKGEFLDNILYISLPNTTDRLFNKYNSFIQQYKESEK